MPIAKTDKGRQALTQRAEHALSQRERQVLILANGKQSRAELVGMLGADAPTLIDGLLARGYLIDFDERSSRTGSSAGSGSNGAGADAGWLSATGTFRRSVEATQAKSRPAAQSGPAPAPAAVQAAPHASKAPAAPAPTAPATTPARRDARRSIAATKMYMVDILQLMRDPDAASLAVDLQTSRDDLMLMQAVREALRYVEVKGAGSLAVRVRQRLGEIVPVEYLGLLNDQVDVDTVIG